MIKGPKITKITNLCVELLLCYDGVLFMDYNTCEFLISIIVSFMCIMCNVCYMKD